MFPSSQLSEMACRSPMRIGGKADIGCGKRLGLAFVESSCRCIMHAEDAYRNYENCQAGHQKKVGAATSSGIGISRCALVRERAVRRRRTQQDAPAELRGLGRTLFSRAGGAVESKPTGDGISLTLQGGDEIKNNRKTVQYKTSRSKKILAKSFQ